VSSFRQIRADEVQPGMRVARAVVFAARPPLAHYRRAMVTRPLDELRVCITLDGLSTPVRPRKETPFWVQDEESPGEVGS
jgi:hypothetical protein